MQNHSSQLAIQTQLRGWLTVREGIYAMEPVPSPLQALLRQVELAIEAKLYYAALAVLFTIPDICASLESDPATPFWANKDKYIKWFDANISNHFTTITGEDFYHMRGGVVHRGQFSHGKSKFDRVAFLLPNSPFAAHDVVLEISPGSHFSGRPIEEINATYPGRPFNGMILFMNVLDFCNTILTATRGWAFRAIEDRNVQTNVSRLVHLREEGLFPLFVGFPIIA